ncbi:hypothetical protein ACLOJK_000818 [Asimina triloba]
MPITREKSPRISGKTARVQNLSSATGPTTMRIRTRVRLWLFVRGAHRFPRLFAFGPVIFDDIAPVAVYIPCRILYLSRLEALDSSNRAPKFSN